MLRLFQDKRWIVALSTIALLALVALAVSLSDIQFHEGQTFSRKEAVDTAQISLRAVVDAWVAVPWWKQAAVWVMLSLLIILIGLLLSPELRKKLLRAFLRAMVTFWVLFYFFKNYGSLIPALNKNVDLNELAQNADAAKPPPPVFVPPHVPAIFSYLISFGIILICLWLLWRLNRLWAEYASWQKHQKPLDELAKIARTTLRDLSSGKDSSDVIVNCYVRMSDVVSARRNLQRDQAMTPTEFASHLEKAGLPADAVHRLTRLFESVRYGAHKSSRVEINEAISCLTSILHYCGETV